MNAPLRITTEDDPPFDPEAQAAIYRAKIDELRLLREIAKRRQDWSLVGVANERIGRFEKTIRRLGWIPKERGLFRD